MRSAFIPMCVAWLVAVSVQAPFAHVHPQESGHHPATGLAHLHLGHLPDDHDVDHDLHSNTPKLDHADDDELTVWQDWAATASPRLALDSAEATGLVVWTPSFVEVGLPPEFTVRGHDPPPRYSSPARAPPA